MKKLKVYVAGPLTTSGRVTTHVHDTIKVADELWELGFVPFVPHLSTFWDIVSPKGYDAWMDYDLEWLAVCDAILRLPGDSRGADREVKVAKKLGIPVFHSIDELSEENELTTDDS